LTKPEKDEEQLSVHKRVTSHFFAFLNILKKTVIEEITVVRKAAHNSHLIDNKVMEVEWKNTFESVGRILTWVTSAEKHQLNEETIPLYSMFLELNDNLHSKEMNFKLNKQKEL
jgi:hypothetical protein